MSSTFPPSGVRDLLVERLDFLLSEFVVRAFVELRQKIAANEEIIRRIKEIDQTILDHEKKFMEHDEVLQNFWAKLKPLLESSPPPRKPIGFR